MLPEAIEQKLKANLSVLHKRQVEILSHSILSGGSINEAMHVKTDAGDYFIKWNNAKRYPAMFEKEAKGLAILKITQTIKVPTVVEVGAAGDFSFLVLEFIKSAEPVKNFWVDFGTSLAHLHKYTNSFFGLDHDNYIGSLEQINKQHDDWISFFVEERITEQIKLARNNGKISANVAQSFDHLFSKLSSLFPKEIPSLLHGDLWNGNYMIDHQGKACIIDPAVYYGFREMDIAMTKLFGGFPASFYESYHWTFPLEPGWQDRIEICNLYPLMVHVNLFGGGYLNSVEQTLKRFA